MGNKGFRKELEERIEAIEKRLNKLKDRVEELEEDE